MALQIPKLVKPGDKVAVVATARVVDEKAVRQGIKTLESWGLQVLQGNSLFECHQLFAGTDEQRLRDLQSALDDPDIRAIICARGGYGTTRIIDQLDWSLFKKSPKWVCGFSDVTALLCAIHNLGFASLHCSMPQLFTGKGADQDIASIRQALFEEPVILEARPYRQNQAGTGEGLVVGGNLSILTHLIGTNSSISTDGKILMLEEVNEYQYQLDRMMVQLARSGKISKLVGVVVGHLTSIKQGDLKFDMDAIGIIKSHLKHLKIPIGFGFPIGHESPNLAIPFGVNAELTVTETGSTLRLKY